MSGQMDMFDFMVLMLKNDLHDVFNETSWFRSHQMGMNNKKAKL